MMIHISEEGIVFCGEISCDPLRLYDIGEECENCPILKFPGKYETIKYVGCKI